MRREAKDGLVDLWVRTFKLRLDQDGIHVALHPEGKAKRINRINNNTRREHSKLELLEKRAVRRGEHLPHWEHST